ncbi:cytochrome c biogenesis protein ResB [Candidatus Latescibacterota bacterium]
MSTSEKNKADTGLIKTLSSLQFALVLIITIAVVAVIGTIIPQGRSLDFYHGRYGDVVNFLIRVFRFDNTYRSPLFLGLLGLFGINLTLCSLIKIPATVKKTFKPDLRPGSESIARLPVCISLEDTSLDEVGKAFGETGFPLRKVDDIRLYGEKGRLGYLGAYIVHLSLLLFLCGGMISLITGFRGYIILSEGESTETAVLSEEQSIPLGFEIRLDRFNVAFYEDYPGRPKSYTSSITVTHPDAGTFEKDIRVNDPLMLNNFTIYQSSYGISEDNAYDTARVEVRLKDIPETMPPVVTLDMFLGEEYTIPGFKDSLKVRLTEIHRNFKKIASVSGEENPAVRIDVMIFEQQRWSIYSFKNFPGLNMPMYDDLRVMFTLIDISASGPKTEEKDSYYTVLGVVSDRGIPVMWAGAICMMLGLFLSFYVRPRRLWVVEENGKINIGGTVKGDSEPLRNFVERTVQILRR